MATPHIIVFEQKLHIEARDEKFILKLHEILKSGTSDSRRDWFAVGAYKKLPNEVGGRVGRLILFKECLKNGIIPFVITDDMKLYYYRGLSEWDNEKGYLTDTCLSAQEVTEKQVFQPERKSLAWTINNRLLNDYGFKYVEAYFLEPNVVSPDDEYKMLTVLNNAGGVTMNMAKDLAYQLYGKASEDYDAEWGDMPLQMAQMQMQGGAGAGMIDGLDAQIKKAAHNHDDEVVTVMKEVQKLLKNGAAGGIVKYDPNQPRDERGRFAESGRDDVALKTLPNYEDAVIPDSKLTGYALNPDKSPDKAKAFKAALGYDINNAEDLADNIKNNLANFEAKEKGRNDYGKLYEVQMELKGPNGKTANVLTAWIDDEEKGEIRLTSTYVKKKG